jgi:hypothetical protein
MYGWQLLNALTTFFKMLPRVPTCVALSRTLIGCSTRERQQTSDAVRRTLTCTQQSKSYMSIQLGLRLTESIKEKASVMKKL